MYVGMTRAKTHLHLLFAEERSQWGERKSNAPSRFLDDLPEQFVQRRSEDILSAFVWSIGGAPSARRGGRLTPANPALHMEFNQDLGDSEESQETIDEGTRVSHPTFGQGTVLSRRGDVVEIAFDGGPKKTFALSIAPLTVL